MSNLTSFQSEQFGQTRVVMAEDGPWFACKDVLSSIGYSTKNLSQQFGSIPSHLKKMIRIPTSQGFQGLTFINKKGLYAFLNLRNTPKNLLYQRYIVNDVLPSIPGQDNDSLIQEENNFFTLSEVEKLLSDPDTIISLATEIKNQRAQISLLENKIKADQKYTVLGEAVASDSDDNISVLDLSNILIQLGQKLSRKI
jgi:anti-repressor protein